MNLLKYTNRLIRVTKPIVQPIFKANRSTLLILLLLSIILGFIPAIKSGIESNFLNEVNGIINSSNSTLSLRAVFYNIFQEKKESDFFENLPNFLTNGQTVLSVIFIYLFAIIITFVIEFYNEKIKTTIGKNIFVSVREAALKKVLNANPSDLPRSLNLSGNFSSSIQIGTANVLNVYNFLSDSVQYIFLLITSLLVLIEKAWLFGVVFLTTILIQIFLSVYRASKLKADRKSLEKTRNNLIGQTEDIISKKEIILAFEQEERYSSKITNLSSTYGELSRSLELRGFVYSNISRIINEIERFIIPFVALLFIIYFDRKAITNVGGLFFLITLYSRLTVPILSILSQYNILKENEATSNSLLDLLEIVNNSIATSQKSEEATETAVTFRNVTFRYDATETIFKNISFTIPKNKTTVILGPSGCGKSSIAKIILGFWPIEGGSVDLMGQPLSSYSDKEIRLFTSYISQGDYIVDDTVKDNLNWGSTEKEITESMMLGALMKVGIIKDSDNTEVLNRFAKELSGGEQQRLSLGRIILDDAPLLILDEPLTGVDVYTIRDIMPEFKDVLERQNRTVILISHKLSFTNSADCVILLSKSGEVIEQGDPKVLVKDKTTTFYKLYQTALQELTLM